MTYTIRNKIRQDFRAAVERFGNNLAYAALAGTCAYDDCSKDSDIDVLVVLNRNKVTPGLLEKRLAFTRDYVRIHEKHGFKPDMYFPGEVISKSMLFDAINGRGCDLQENGLLGLPALTHDSDWTPEREYRCWQSMAAFNNNQFISGDRNLYNLARQAACAEISKLVIYDSDIDGEMKLQYLCNEIAYELLSKGKGYYGIRKRNELGAFIKDFQGMFSKAVPLLEKTGVLERSGDNIKICRQSVLERIMETADKIKNKRFKSSPLFNWNEIR